MQQQQFSDSLERDDRKRGLRPTPRWPPPLSYLLSGLSRNSFPRPTLIGGAHHFSFLFTSDVYVVNAGRQPKAVFYQENCSPCNSSSSVRLPNEKWTGRQKKIYIFFEKKKKKRIERKKKKDGTLKERKKENILLSLDR